MAAISNKEYIEELKKKFELDGTEALYTCTINGHEKIFSLNGIYDEYKRDAMLMNYFRRQTDGINTEDDLKTAVSIFAMKAL